MSKKTKADERSVLVVDDDPAIRELLERTLSAEGYECESAANGCEALERLAERAAAFVLTDVRMPEMDGLELLDQVSAHHPDSYVILLTAAADVPMVVQALRAGASDFLTKPFSLEDLRARMRVAEQKRAEEIAQRVSDFVRERRLEGLQRRYQRLTEGVVASLSAVLDMTHPDTYAHSERVALRAAAVASAMGASEEDVRGIYVAGLLHDLGKVTLTADVLNKEGALGPDELQQMRTHPERGARIVQQVALPPLTQLAIRHHHERWDGTGYPDHLRGEEIPFGARVLAVCDAYDAMVSRRAYKPALPQEEGLARLRRASSTHFDPAVIDTFCSLCESNELE